MKLRLAKKICKAMREDGGDRYTGWQHLQAVNRNERTRSSKEAQSFWDGLMVALGPEGRADLTQRFIERDEDREAFLTFKQAVGDATESDLKELEQVRRNLAYFRDRDANGA